MNRFWSGYIWWLAGLVWMFAAFYGPSALDLSVWQFELWFLGLYFGGGGFVWWWNYKRGRTDD